MVDVLSANGRYPEPAPAYDLCWLTRRMPDAPDHRRGRPQQPLALSAPMAHTRVYRNGTLEAEGFDPEKISDYLAEDGTLVWLDLCTDDGDHLSLISEELNLDGLAVEDALNRRQRPKVDRYPGHLFLTVYSVRVGRTVADLSLAEVSAFVTDRALVTVHDAAFHPDELTDRWDSSPDLLVGGSGGLLHGLLDLVVDSHFDAVQRLDDEVDDIEDLLFEDRQDKNMQQRTFAMRKSLVRLRRVVLPMREVLNMLLRRDLRIVGPELTANYQDVYDHTLRASEWTESLRDMTSTIFETHLSMQDHRLNDVMKKLAAWAAIISVPTAVTGYFGQNVPYPGSKPGVGHVLPEVAGHRCGHGDDRGPGGELLHDVVEPVVLHREVRLEDGADHVAQTLGPLRGAQCVVVHVLVVRGQVSPDDVQVAAQERVEDLTHGQHHAAQPARETCASRTCVAACASGAAHQEQLLDVVDLVIQALDGVEVGVHDQVQQAVQKAAGAPGQQVGGRVPAAGQVVCVQPLVVDGDQGPVRDERGDLCQA